MSDQEQNRRISDDRLLQLAQSQDSLRDKVEEMTLKMVETIAEIKGWRGNHEHMMQDMQHLLHRHDTVLHGDGTTANPGLVVNHDRIKNITDSRTWHIRTLWVTIVGMVGAWLSNLFGLHK